MQTSCLGQAIHMFKEALFGLDNTTTIGSLTLAAGYPREDFGGPPCQLCQKAGQKGQCPLLALGFLLRCTNFWRLSELLRTFRQSGAEPESAAYDPSLP